MYAAMETARDSSHSVAEEPEDRFVPSDRFLRIREAAIERDKKAKIMGAQQ